jgi:hypothetical protein
MAAVSVGTAVLAAAATSARVSEQIRVIFDDLSHVLVLCAGDVGRIKQ